MEYLSENYQVITSYILSLAAFFGVITTLIRMRKTDKQFADIQENAQKQFQLAEDSRLDTRFKDAVTLLASENRAVRIGALYALVEISKSESKCITESELIKDNSVYVSPYPKAVVEIICSFIRNQSNIDYDEHLATKKEVVSENFTELRKSPKYAHMNDVMINLVAKNKTMIGYGIKDDIQIAIDVLFRTDMEKLDHNLHKNYFN